MPRSACTLEKECPLFSLSLLPTLLLHRRGTSRQHPSLRNFQSPNREVSLSSFSSQPRIITRAAPFFSLTARYERNLAFWPGRSFPFPLHFLSGRFHLSFSFLADGLFPAPPCALLPNRTAQVEFLFPDVVMATRSHGFLFLFMRRLRDRRSTISFFRRWSSPHTLFPIPRFLILACWTCCNAPPHLSSVLPTK